MLASDVYHPEQWHDFFIMVGGAAAVLTGLVFVALSLDLRTIVSDATHRYRAIGTLTNFAAVFVLCALVLMGGQGHVAVGAEWLVVALVAGAIYVYGYLAAFKGDGARDTLSVARTVVGTGLFLAQAVGALVLMAGSDVGLYVAAVAMVLLTAYSVTGAWLLLAGVCQGASDDPA
jgi:modulator of FtsH protease